MINKIINKIIYIILLFSSIIIVIYAAINSSGINSDSNNTNNDKWILNGYLSIIDSNSLDYKKGIRGYILPGLINSTLFGNFYFNKIILSNSISKYCKDSSGKSVKTYNITGIISSNLWGTGKVLNTSYYCPTLNNNNFKLSISSSFIGIKDLTSPIVSSGSVNYTIYNKKQVYVNGIVKILGNTNSLLGVSDGTIGLLNKNINKITIYNSLKSNINKDISKNIEIYTRGIIPENIKTNGVDSSVSNFLGKIKINTFNNIFNKMKYLYFNFEGKIGNDNSYGNRGKNLIITNGNYSSLDPFGYGIGIKGQNTIIVKGGNIYINADIYNENDSSSLLILIAKRDYTNKKNGGNIYINPNVTNIDAILIADGSILNYNGSKVISKNNYIDFLRKQLLIYGSIYSSNVIGTNKIPYGSDKYVNKTSVMTNNIYDLSNLRTFNITYSDDPNISSSLCKNPNNTYFTPIGGDNGITEYAWAGKYKCYNKNIDINSNGLPTGKLRTSNLFTPVIINYNSYISIFKPDILSIH